MGSSGALRLPLGGLKVIDNQVTPLMGGAAVTVALEAVELRGRWHARTLAVICVTLEASGTLEH